MRLPNLAFAHSDAMVMPANNACQHSRWHACDASGGNNSRHPTCPDGVFQ